MLYELTFGEEQQQLIKLKVGEEKKKDAMRGAPGCLFVCVFKLSAFLFFPLVLSVLLVLFQCVQICWQDFTR